MFGPRRIAPDGPEPERARSRYRCETWMQSLLLELSFSISMLDEKRKNTVNAAQGFPVPAFKLD